MTRLLIAAVATAAASTAGAQSVNVRLVEWKIEMRSDTLRAGTITFQVNNGGQMTHGLAVRGEGVDKATRDIPARQAETLTLTLKPGTYEVFCPMSEESHKQAGMARKIVVLAADK